MRPRHFILFAFVFSLSLGASRPLPTASDAKATFNEMLSLHVEQNKVTPPLLHRAFHIYIDQFDASKMYLLDSEVAMIDKIKAKRLKKGVSRFEKGDFSDFAEVNGLVTLAIQRASDIRHETQRKFILSTQGMSVERGAVYLTYPKTEEQLRERIEQQMSQVLLHEKKLANLEDWSPADREKIFEMWEGRFAKRERGYLARGTVPHHSVKALAKSLDAHTAYFSPAEAAELRALLEKQFEGVGISLRQTITGVVISDVVQGGPAEKSGRVQKGDQIISIDGKDTAKMSYDEVLEALKGERGESLYLGLRRGHEETEVKLTRQPISLDAMRLTSKSHPVADGQIAILTLPSFYEGTNHSGADRDIRLALLEMRKRAPLKGVILDLRDNAGGFLSQAVKIAGLFISRGVIVISKYSGGEIKYLRNIDGRVYFDGPMVVLTSKASASAAEIVAQALQDYGTALVVGDPHTYGKGTIQYQNVTDRNARAFYKVTVGRYYTVSGRSTQIEGVQADIVVPSIYYPYKIGERFLDYPLASDTVKSAYVDPLTDVSYNNRMWLSRNYLPLLSPPEFKWHKHLDQLRKNSQQRLENDPNFAAFLADQKKSRGRSIRLYQNQDAPWGDNDLQLDEAVNIIKDMISSCQETSSTAKL